MLRNLISYKWKYYLGVLLKNQVKRFFTLNIHRDTNHVLEEYKEHWEKPQLWVKKLHEWDSSLWVMDGKPVTAQRAEYFKHSLQSISEELDGCTSILELGAGLGFNLLALAVLRPEIKTLIGIELTQNGVLGAQWLLSTPPINELSLVTGRTPETIQTILKDRDIQVIQGDMRNVPFETNSFDCVFSRQAIEQLSHDYPKAFSEAFRVTKKLGIFVEEFREVQNMFTLIYLRNNDYFRYSYKVAEQAGFSVRKFKRVPLCKIKYYLATLVCSKK